MKRFIAAMLVLTLCFTSLTALAASPTATMAHSSEITEVSDEIAFSNLFPTTYSGETLSRQADYTYEIQIDPETELYFAVMNITFNINGQTFQTEVDGVLSQTLLENGQSFLTGPLYGNLVVGSDSIPIIVGFNYVNGIDDISGYVTISTSENPLIFHFGGYILTDDIKTQLISMAEDTMAEPFSDVRAGNGLTLRPSYQHVGGPTTGYLPPNLDSTYTGKQHVSNVYYKAATSTDIENTLCLSVTSFADELQQKNWDAYYTKVYEVTTYLTRGSTGQSVPRVTDFLNYNDIQTNKVNTSAGKAVGNALFAIAKEVFSIDPSKLALIQKVYNLATEDTRIYPRIYNDGGNLLAETSTTFGPSGANFDDYPFEVLLLLSGDRNNSTYQYKLNTSLTYCQLQDGGLTYIGGSRLSQDFKINYKHP